MRYKVSYYTGEEKEFVSFADAIEDIRRLLKNTYAKGWFVRSQSGCVDDYGIEKDFSITGTGNREWVIGRDIDVSNSWREFAYIEEEK